MTTPSKTPLTNGFPTRVVERAIQEALHPIGMSTHSGKVTLDISHVQRIIARSRQIETALAESRAEADKQRQIAANWQNMAAMHKAERDEARAECERLRYTNKILAKRSFELQTNLTAVLEGKNNDLR